MQKAYNKTHGITPKGVSKAIIDIMEGARQDVSTSSERYLKTAEKIAEYERMSPAELGKKIKALENAMLEHAQNLEFEEAAKLRDEVHQLKEAAIGLG